MSSLADLVTSDDNQAGLFEGFTHGGVGVDLARLLCTAGKGPLGLAVMPTRQ
jgi:hypothetical protein